MTPLPSFLTEDAPGRYTLTFSSSGADTFNLCSYKYMWGYVAGIEGATARAGQNYGSGLHLPLSCYYKALREGRTMDEALKEECKAIIQQHFLENPQPETTARGKVEFRNAARAIQAFEAYLARWGSEDFEVLGVEEPFEVELGRFEAQGPPYNFQLGSDPVIVTVIFRGIRDLRVRWHDQLWVMDHKTSTEWSDLSVDEGKASFQFMGYAWVEKQICEGYHPYPSIKSALTLPIGGVIGNYIVSRAPYAEGRKPTPRDLPRDYFHREAYPYDEAQLNEWHSDAMEIAREIFSRWQSENWKRNRTACAHWGRCEFYRLCWETAPEYREAAALGADYRPRTPSPFEEENGKERA